ncbi:MAG: hypothetical protein GY701_36085 [Sulfitobacter sp.]|nr:hypothetical protein [Sulfitobacter sp.]
MNAMAARSAASKPIPKPEDATAPEPKAQDAAGPDGAAPSAPIDAMEPSDSAAPPQAGEADKRDGPASGAGLAELESTADGADSTDDEHRIELGPVGQPVDEESSLVADEGPAGDGAQDLDVAEMLELLRRHRHTRPEFGIER